MLAAAGKKFCQYKTVCKDVVFRFVQNHLGVKIDPSSIDSVWRFKTSSATNNNRPPLLGIAFNDLSVRSSILAKTPTIKNSSDALVKIVYIGKHLTKKQSLQAFEARQRQNRSQEEQQQSTTSSVVSKDNNRPNQNSNVRHALCSEIEKCVYINKPWYPSANILIQDRLLKFVERGLDDEQEEKEFGVLNSGRCYKITRDENGEVQLVATKAKRKAKNEEKETEQKEKQKIDFFILFDKKKEVQVVLRELMTVAEETGYIPSEIKCYKALTEKQFDIASNRIRHIQTALSTCVKVVKPTSTSQTLEREKEKNQAARNDEEASCNNESGSGRAVCCSGKEERNKVYNDEKENDDDQRKLERRQQQLGDKPNRKKREVVQLIDALTSTSPLFLLFLDCVYQLIVQNPFLFEFTDDLLIELYCSVCYCCHHTFLFNNVGERLDAMKNCPNHLLLLLLSTFGFSLYLSLKSRLITEKPDERSSSKENEELASFTGKKRSRSKWSTEAAITELLDSNVIFGKRERKPPALYKS
ncbi:unnamed protein product [Didymodactylos carnosus]|uniref:Myotubularin phosphatase domain-containing protein n=1 Tax=Didymodactylos carnosus TaxID=1234261 RepID=A0A814MMF8_9BILA|nr:unnamed protein product [Didymodactylos carnosus]CAF3844663.1 unnamed protein product [Didymodactylos carnosus]